MGSKHGDTSALCKLMGTVQSWVDTPLTAAQLQTEDEGGEDADSSKCHLPKMALASKGMMGALMTASFCERIKSVPIS